RSHRGRAHPAGRAHRRRGHRAASADARRGVPAPHRTPCREPRGREPGRRDHATGRSRGMSTVTPTPGPASGPTPEAAPAPANVPHQRLYWTFADCWTVARRGLTHLIRQPSNIAWQLGFPIVSVLLFGYVFGSAMSVP